MFKCVGCAQQNKTRWARHDRNVMPWAKGNKVQVRGLCTTKQDTMGLARQKSLDMGHRQQWSSVWAVQSQTRRNTHTTDAHLVALVDTLEMMIVLLLFLQKQNLAFAVYLLGSVLSLPD